MKLLNSKNRLTFLLSSIPGKESNAFHQYLSCRDFAVYIRFRAPLNPKNWFITKNWFLDVGLSVCPSDCGQDI